VSPENVEKTGVSKARGSPEELVDSPPESLVSTQVRVLTPPSGRNAGSHQDNHPPKAGHRSGGAGRKTKWGVREWVDSGDLLQPFLIALDGGLVSYRDLVSAGRRMAGAPVAHGRPVSLCDESYWAGVWDLEKLSDGETVDWGLCVATKTRGG
jgi:hypothetical protein